MIQIAFFPTSVETLPAALYINRFSDTYRVSTLLALPGTSLCGRDAGYADNRGKTGFIVSESLDATKDAWDVLFAAQQSDQNDEAHIYELTCRAMARALELGKRVFCAARLSPEDLARFTARTDALFTYLPETEIPVNPFRPASIFQPSSYVIFFGGLIHAVNAFEPFLNLFGTLRQEYDVLPFSTDINSELCGIQSLYPILNAKSLSETDKVYAINNFIRTRCEKTPPDIILVHLAEPMMEYNDRLTNGFGILPFMLSRALTPDYFVCGMPGGYGSSAYIDSISEGISGRFGFGIDYVHLSNVQIDASVVYEHQNMTLYAPFSAAEAQLQYCADTDIPAANLLTAAGLDDLHAAILDELAEYNSIKSIIN